VATRYGDVSAFLLSDSSPDIARLNGDPAVSPFGAGNGLLLGASELNVAPGVVIIRYDTVTRVGMWERLKWNLGFEGPLRQGI